MKKYSVPRADLHEPIEGRCNGCAAVYLVADVDAVLKRQAAAATSGMNAATAISSHQLETARKLSAESKPEAIDSERSANALLTAEIEQKDTRIAELEKALQDKDAALLLAAGDIEESDKSLLLIAEAGDDCPVSELKEIAREALGL